MWQAPNSRTRTSNKKRSNERMSRPLHIRRVDIGIKIPSPEGERASVVRMLLSDISPKGLCLYTSVALTPGQEISLSMVEPQPFELKAQVAWCQAQPSAHHILSANPFLYRAGVVLEFSSPEQMQAFASFCQKMSDEYNSAPAAQAA
jgi:hypothetical protein